MLKLGYQASCWLMRSDDHGADLAQGKICTIYDQKDLCRIRGMLLKLHPIRLPVNAMSNLLMSVRIPQKVLCRDQEKPVVGKSNLPCKLKQKAKQG
jgi:hypothetical protein